MNKVFNTRWLIIELIIFYCVLSSARAVCTFGQNTIIDAVLSLIVFIYFSSNNLFKFSQGTLTASFLLIIAILWSMHGCELHAYLGEILMVSIPLMLINLKSHKQIELLIFMSKALAIVLLISFIAWFASFWGIQLPHTTEYLDFDYTYGVISENYFLYRNTISLGSSGVEIIQDYYRFNGIFLEPGHTGTIVAFFLMANQYDLSKWYNKILLGILLITLSAAAYVLALLGYVFIMVNKKKGIKMLLYFFLILIAISFVINYNGGDNAINQTIVEKLFGSGSGVQNRFTDEVKRAYDNLWANGEFLLGASNKVNVSHSAGYKVFIIQQGLLGSFLVVMAYYFIQRAFPTKLGFFFFILVMVSFVQRVYFSWDAFLDPYILGLSNMLLTNKKITVHSTSHVETHSLC